jgi:transposase-like protein
MARRVSLNTGQRATTQNLPVRPSKLCEMPVWTIELAISKVRPRTYLLPLLQPRRHAEHALLAVVQEAYVHGVSARRVDELMQRRSGPDGVSLRSATPPNADVLSHR